MENKTQDINIKKWDINFNYATDIIAKDLEGLLDLEDKNIIDFGCGPGVKTLGMAQRYSPKQILGVDISADFEDIDENAQKFENIGKLPDNLRFKKIKPGEKLYPNFQPDIIYSWSVFEHVHTDIITQILQDHYELLVKGGVDFIQINPLYYSPYGSHLRSWIDEPWAHLKYQLNRINEKLFESQQNIELAGILAQKEEYDRVNMKKPGPWYLFYTLNKITLSRLKNIVESVGFHIIKETIGKTKLHPDPELLEIYQKDILITEGVRLVLQK